MSEQEQPKDIICNRCGFKAPIYKWHPSLGMFSDCRCPECGSTDNQHNADYAQELHDAMKNFKENEEKV